MDQKDFIIVLNLGSDRTMVSKQVALREAKKIRSKGYNARIVYVTKGLGGKKTWMIESSRKK